VVNRRHPQRPRHHSKGWTLLVLIGIHVATAMVHIFIFRVRIMQRMLPG